MRQTKYKTQVAFATRKASLIGLRLELDMSYKANNATQKATRCL
jgi:hypothetical protein